MCSARNQWCHAASCESMCSSCFVVVCWRPARWESVLLSPLVDFDLFSMLDFCIVEKCVKQTRQATCVDLNTCTDWLQLDAAAVSQPYCVCCDDLWVTFHGRHVSCERTSATFLCSCVFGRVHPETFCSVFQISRCPAVIILLFSVT